MKTKLPIPAIKISKECFCLSLKKAERLISKRYDEALAPFGLRNGQFSMLVCISDKNPINIQSIAHYLNMDRTTTTAALKPLEKSKLIKINISEEDSRLKLVSITPLGMSLLTKAIPAWQKIQDQIKADISLDGFTKLKEQLRLLH